MNFEKLLQGLTGFQKPQLATIPIHFNLLCPSLPTLVFAVLLITYFNFLSGFFRSVWWQLSLFDFVKLRDTARLNKFRSNQRRSLAMSTLTGLFESTLRFIT